MTTPDAVSPPRRQLWFTRVFYFSLMGGYGFLFPFLPLFYHRQGLRGTQIGLISTVTAVIALVAAPLWGRWSDAARQPRRLLQASLVAAGILILWLGQQQAFLGILTLVAAHAFVSAGTTPLSDTLALGVVRRARSGFGSVRLGGSLGWAVVTAVGGRLIELGGLTIGFIGYAAGAGSSAIVASLFPTRSVEDAAATERGSLRQVASALRRNRAMAALGIALSLSWSGYVALPLFETIFLDQLGASEWLIGFASAIPAVVELGAMLWADRLERRRGAAWMLRLAFLIDAGRFAAILLAPTVTTIVAVRLASGIRFSLYSVAIIAYVNQHTSSQQNVTVLALYTVTLRNLIQMISSPIIGLTFDAFGAYWLYAIVLVGNLSAWLVLKQSSSNTSIDVKS